MEKLMVSLPENNRRRTNSSLIEERINTDKAFENQSVFLENATDVIVENDRIKADQKRLERRIVVDQEIAKNSEKSSGKNLNRERDDEDKAIKTERQMADKALGHERSYRKTELHHRLEQTRENTDKNLLIERIRNDFQASESTSLLTAEQNAHASTRAALTTREEFLAIVSHDLRNPIGMISSCSEMLLTDFPFVGASKEMKGWIEMIKRNADTSLRLIRDILDMERIAQGKLELRMTECNLFDLIRETIENHSQIALAKSILLRFPHETSVNKFSFDRDRISQVLANLVGNALKFTPEGGSITIELLNSDSEVKVSVIDTGAGIADEKQSRIFERYAQIHDKDRRGVGLGLYISRTFVELHRGKLEVVSSPGKGSTFYFTLPK